MSRIANRPLTKPRDPHGFADLAQVIAAIGLLIIPAFLYASQQANLHDARKHINALEDALIAEAERRELLLVQHAIEQDPRRVHEKAERLAGLGTPSPGQVSYLSRSAVPPADLVADSRPGPDGHP